MSSKVPIIIVFGPTGQTGRATLRTILQQNLQVTVFVRNPEKLPADLKDRVKIVTGNVLDAESVSKAIKGHDAVISCLGTGSILGPTRVMSEGCENIVTAMRCHGVRKLAIVSTGFWFYLFKYIIPFGAVRDHFRQINFLHDQKDIDWIALMSPYIRDKNTVGEYQVALGKTPGNHSITTHELADFLIKSVTDEATMNKYRHGLVGISSQPASGNALSVVAFCLIVGAVIWWYFK